MNIERSTLSLVTAIPEGWGKGKRCPVFSHRNKGEGKKAVSHPSISFLIILFLSGLSVVTPLQAQKITSLTQGANGSAGAPLSPVQWVPGNLNAAKAHFTEGMTLPYRLEVENLLPGESYCVTIGWETRQKGKPAIDFLTSYDRSAGHDAFGHAAETIDPLAGTALAGTAVPPQFAPLPAPAGIGSPVPGQPAAAFTALPAQERRFAIFNGRITAIRYVEEEPLNGDRAAAALEVCFELLPGSTVAPSVVLAWGGHFASADDWGPGMGASSIRGGTIQTYLVDCVGLNGCGARTVPIQSSAIAGTGDCNISGPASICPETETVFSAVGAGEGRLAWNLLNNGAGASIKGPKNKQTVTVETTGSGFFDLELTIDRAVTCTKRIYVLDGADFGLAPAEQVLCQGSAPEPITWTGSEESSVLRTFRLRDAGGRLLAKGLTAEELAAQLTGLTGTYFVFGFVRPEFDVDCGVETAPVRITFRPAPVADFEAAPVCSGQAMAFQDLSSSTEGEIASWSWDFAGLASSTEQHPAFTFPAPGIYEVTLTVTDDLGCENSATQTVVVHARPEPDFALDGGCSGAELTFSNLSKTAGDIPASYEWDFGDGSAGSTQENPVHTYQQGGAYMARLRVTDANGCSTVLAREVNIRQSPLPGFSTNALCTGQEVPFTNTTLAGDADVLLYEWQFGDGFGSLLADPVHTYAAPGAYLVTLTATDAGGCTAVYEKTVQVNAPPVAAFEPGTACLGESLAFASTSIAGSGAITAYRWQFGDGEESEVAAPQHRYEEAGSYEVVLTVTNEYGCSDDYSATVVVYPPVEIAAGEDLAVCESESVQLQGSVGGGAVRALWSDNGAGGTFRPRASVLEAVYFPPAGFTGDLTLTLISEDPEGPCPARSDELVLTVYPAAVVDAGPDRRTCAGAGAPLAGTIAGGAAAATWSDDGAGGRFEPAATALDAQYFPPAGFRGELTLTLTSNDPAGPCGPVQDALTLTVVPPLEVAAGEDLELCADESVALAGQVNGDFTAAGWSDNGAGGRFEPAADALQATYFPPAGFSGNIILTLSATDVQSPCPEASDELTLTVHPVPAAGFSAADVCHRQAVDFVNLTESGADLRFEWDFGDGASSTERAPGHVFPAPGVYEVTLTAISSAGCVGQVTHPVAVYAKPLPDFAVDGSCAGQPLGFTDLSDLGEGETATYEWDFGDGTTSTDKDPVHTFAAGGAYQIRLRVTNDKGCTTTLSRELNVSGGPAAAFSADPVCAGAPTLFIQAAESAGAAITGYHWDFGDGSESTEASPQHTFSAAGVYLVTLTVTDSKGCTGAVEQEVEVWALPTPAFDVVGACLGQPVSFLNRSGAGAADIEKYEWDFGDGNGSPAFEPTHSYKAAGNYTVRLTATDGNGCSAMVEAVVAIGAPPEAAFEAESVCAGEIMAFANRSRAGGSPLQRFEWQFGDGNGSAEVNPEHRYAAPGVYDVVLTVFDDKGCSHSVVRSVQVLELPVPDFAAEVFCAEGRVAFTDLSGSAAGAIVLYDWRFGDGGSSREQEPGHTYAAPGTYEVVLTVTDERGCSAALSRTVVVPAPPVAAFAVAGGCPDEGVVIENQSRPSVAAAPLQYTWVVRDAREREVARSRETAPTFDLPPGSYLVELTVIEEGGCTAIASRSVEVYPDPVVVIEAAADRVCQGESTMLTATLEGAAPCEPLQWERARSAAGPWQRLAGGEGATYTTASDLEPATYFYRVLYQCDAAGCGTIVSDVAEVRVGTGSPNLGCNNNVRLTLRSDCSLDVSPDMVAEGTFGFCFPYREEDFEVIVYDGRYGDGEADNRVDGWGVFPYKLQLKPAARQAGGVFVPCWGELTVIDATAPAVTCPADVAGLIREEKGTYRPALRAREAVDGEAFHFLLCEEQSLIYNEERSWEDPTYAYYTGRPTAGDACGEAVLIKVNDRLERPGCTEASLDFGGQIDSRLVRTFTFSDAQGNTTTCDQTIYFFRPRIELPPCDVRLDWCLYGDGQDLDPLLTETAPFYYNALGERFWLTQFTCGFSVAYEDESFAGEAGCGFAVRRRWAILDDCRVAGLDVDLIGTPPAGCPGDNGWSGNLYSFEQWLRVEDNSAPVVSCPSPPTGEAVLTFPTGSFGCSAVVAPPTPVVEGECRDWSWEFELYALVVNPVTQRPEYQLIGTSEAQRLAGVLPGEYDLIYLVRDGCGNETRSERCPLLVVDGVAPTAICEDDLQVSLGSGNANGYGVATLAAENVGGASRDECGPVTLDIRRTIAAACLDTYVQAVTQTETRFEELRRVEEDGGLTVYFYGQRRLVVEEQGSYYSPWAASVFFTCCDAGSAGVDIELRATDGAGLSNSCASTVRVEDKLPPRCSATDQVIACTELDFDPRDPDEVAARFGAPQEVVRVFDNCGATVEERLVWMPANCGRGLLERLFTVTDAAGLSAQCSQTITVEGVTDYEFRLPGDATLPGCGPVEAAGLSWQSDGCDMIAISRDTLPFEAVEGACRRLMITYEVINWCEYDAAGNTTPTRIARDADNDDRLDEPTWVVVAYDDDDRAVVAKVFGADAAGNRAAQPLRVYRPGDRGYNPGYFSYTQFVDIVDEQAPTVELLSESTEFCSGEIDCRGEFRLELALRDNCPLDAAALREIALQDEAGNPLDAAEEDLRLEREGERLLVAGALPAGSYRLVLRVADGCQNTAAATIDFRIEDCTPPAPICRGVLTADLAPVDTDNDGRFDAGEVTLPFDAFLASTITDCSPFDDEPLHQVKYYLSREMPQSVDDLQDREMTFTCADEGVVEVFVIALDAAGNFGACPVQVVVDPGTDPNPCQAPVGNGAVAGLISTEWDKPVEEVEVRLSGIFNTSVMTDQNGMYAFEGVEEGYDYTLAPLLDREYVNGVTTFDLLQISKHILAEDPLDSPYQMIAADANRSGSITSFDLIQLRKLILTLISDLPDNTSWRFVDGAHRFLNPADPWKGFIPEVININDLFGRLDDKDFVAVKVGDVNGTARTSMLTTPEIRSTAGSLPLYAADRELQAGAIYRVPVRARDLASIAGYQFTLEWDRDLLDLLDLEYGRAREEHFGVFPAEGVLTTSWLNDPVAVAGAEEEEVLFTLVVRARRTGRLSQALWLTSRYTTAEGYDRDGTLLEMLLRFEDGVPATAAFELLPVQPNPWRDYTLIGFTLPEAGAATLSVLDVNGRLLQRMRGDFERGYNQVRLDRRQLPAGVLYLTLESDRQTATRKMILLE